MFAEGDEEAGSKNGSGPWQSVKQREVGMVLGALRHSGIDVGNGLQRDAELGNESLHQENVGGDDTVIGGECHGPLDGLEAGSDDVNRGHVVSPEAPFQGGAARKLRGFESWPAAEAVTKDRRIFVGKPLQDLWKVVFEGTGQAICTTAFVPDQATAVFDELGAGTPGRALGLEGLKLIPVFEEECDLKFRIAGIVFGPARDTRFAVPGHGERIDGKEPEEIIVTQRRHDGPLIEFQAHSDGLSVESCAEGLDPGINLFRAMFKTQKLTVFSASGLEADIVCRISPVEANKGRKCFGWLLLDV